MEELRQFCGGDFLTVVYGGCSHKIHDLLLKERQGTVPYPNDQLLILIHTALMFTVKEAVL